MQAFSGDVNWFRVVTANLMIRPRLALRALPCDKTANKPMECNMAISPGINPAPKPRFNETAIAIGGSFVIAMILATLLTGNPFRATQLAYTDYSGTPAAGAPKASTTHAPAVSTEPANRPSADHTPTNG